MLCCFYAIGLKIEEYIQECSFFKKSAFAWKPAFAWKTAFARKVAFATVKHKLTKKIQKSHSHMDETLN